MRISATILASRSLASFTRYASCENRAFLPALFRAVITRQSSSVIKTLAGCVTLRCDQDLPVPRGRFEASRPAFDEVIYAPRAAIIKRPFAKRGRTRLFDNPEERDTRESEERGAINLLAINFPTSSRSNDPGGRLHGDSTHPSSDLETTYS